MDHDNPGSPQNYPISREPVIDTFSRVLQHNIYIVDWQSQRVVQSSELSYFRFGVKVGAISLDELKNYILPADLEKYRLMQDAYAQAFEHASPDTVVSSGLTAKIGGNQVFLHVHAYPVDFFPDGLVRTVMFMVTTSVQGNNQTALWYDGVNMYHYNYDVRRWEKNTYFKKLTNSESTMLLFSRLGFSINEIAEKMFRSVETVKLYRRNVFRKYNVENITQAIQMAIIFRHI